MHDYYYETLKANDPILFMMGKSSNCCFKIGGDADSFVKYCANDPNGREKQYSEDSRHLLLQRRFKASMYSMKTY